MPVRSDIDRETSQMDRITQLQDATDQLIEMMFASIDYLTRKATFKQVSPNIPITQDIPDSEEPAVFEANKTRMVQELLHKAKQVEYLINALPSSAALEGDNVKDSAAAQGSLGDDVDTDPEFIALEAEMKEVNAEYLEVLAQAEEVQGQLKQTIRTMLDEHSELNSGLLAI